MQKVSDRRGEKGAALVISILIATLLLAVAGTVILTTSMSAVTSIDATAELQAYYGAETGLEAALNVIRGHAQPNGIAGTTRMSFLNAVKRTTSNHANDEAAVARLSAWLNYDQNVWRVKPSGANYSYSLVVLDPDDPTGALRNADATYRPTRIQVQSTGYGPKGSTKRMEMVVMKVSFDFEPDAMLLARSSDDGSLANMTFDIGTSAAKFYSGHDNAGSTNLPTFGVTSVGDLAVANSAITVGATVEEVKTYQVAMEDLPPWLLDADAAREFLNYMQIVARSMGRYQTSLSGMAGSTSQPAFTFVNGNAKLDGGAGLLIVTGELVLDGNAVFNGIILVLGEGEVIRSGGGNSTILGSIYVAKFARSWPSSENGLPHPFLAPVVQVGGGGTANFIYDSNWVQKGKDALGDIVRDVREF